jgi:hypothetical protein
MPTPSEQAFWIRRLEAVSKAESRYLWLLLIAGLFYAALHARNVHVPIKVPIVDLELDSLTVLASGGPTIAFLVLVMMGAVRAWSRALQQIRGSSSSKDAEQLDMHPNAIDLAVYTTQSSPAFIRKVLYFAYPVILSGALIESLVFANWLWRTPSVSGRAFFLTAQVLIWIPAAILVLGMWVSRIKHVGTARAA